MEVKEEIIEEMLKEIEVLFSSALTNTNDMNRLQKLISIYAAYTAIKLNKAQLDVAKASQEFMRNVDISSIDFNGLIKSMKGAG